MARKPTDQQRALWTFLVTTLVAPFLAALIVLAAGASIAAIGHFMPPAMAALDPAQRMGWAAGTALQAFVWAAWPAALAGGVMAGLLVWKGEVTWLAASVSGGVSSVLFAVLAGKGLAPHLTPIAFTGACLGVAIWWGLTRVRILR